MSKGIRINGMIREMIERKIFHRLLLAVIFLFNIEKAIFCGEEEQSQEMWF